MAAELRWILAGLGVLLIAGIWWWGARRSRQAPGNAELRETTAGAAPAPARAAGSGCATEPRRAIEEAGLTDPANDSAPRDWGVPPFEPLTIRTAEFDELPAMDPPMSSRVEPLRDTPHGETAEAVHEPPAALASPPSLGMRRPQSPQSPQSPRLTPQPQPPQSPQQSPRLTPQPQPPQSPRLTPQSQSAQSPRLAPHAPPPQSPRLTPQPPQPPPQPPQPPQPPRATPGAPPSQPAPPPQSPQVDPMRHIVSIRVCAPADAQWAGVDLLAALENHGLAHGRHSVFHRKHSDGRTQFYAASLVEPGTFSLASMPHQEFRGLTLYAILPGPVEPLQTLDALIETAGALAQTLDGSLLDSAGLPLTVQSAEALREDIARFQSRLATIAPGDHQ